jgi:hypothetical protein
VCPWSCVFYTCTVTDKMCEAWFVCVFVYCKRYTRQISTKFFSLNLTFAVDHHPERKRADGQTDALTATFVMWINLVVKKKRRYIQRTSCSVLEKLLPRADKDFSTCVWMERVISNEANSCWTYCVGPFHKEREGFELSLRKKVSFRFFLQSLLFCSSNTAL